MRKIHRDIKEDFYLQTSFSFNKLYREDEYFTNCLDIYAQNVFGETPTQKEKILLGKKQLFLL